jgi:hypothetical protein
MLIFIGGALYFYNGSMFGMVFSPSWQNMVIQGFILFYIIINYVIVKNNFSYDTIAKGNIIFLILLSIILMIVVVSIYFTSSNTEVIEEKEREEKKRES